MFDELPMDLLYLQGPKYRADVPSADVWMPIWPCDRALTSRSLLVFRSDGYMLKLSIDDQVYGIQECTIQTPKFELRTWNDTRDDVLSMELPSSTIEVMEVCCHGTDDADEHAWSMEQQGRTHFLLIEGKAGKSPLQDTVERGALLHSTRQDGNKQFLQYICAVSLRRKLVAPGPASPAAYLTNSDINDDMYLERGE